MQIRCSCAWIDSAVDSAAHGHTLIIQIGSVSIKISSLFHFFLAKDINIMNASRFPGSTVNGLSNEVPLVCGTEIRQFPAGSGACLKAVMVSPILAGEKREGQQRKASEGSDVFPIVGSKSISDTVEHIWYYSQISVLKVWEMSLFLCLNAVLYLLSTVEYKDRLYSCGFSHQWVWLIQFSLSLVGDVNQKLQYLFHQFVWQTAFKFTLVTFCQLYHT